MSPRSSPSPPKHSHRLINRNLNNPNHPSTQPTTAPRAVAVLAGSALAITWLAGAVFLAVGPHRQFQCCVLAYAEGEVAS